MRESMNKLSCCVLLLVLIGGSWTCALAQDSNGSGSATSSSVPNYGSETSLPPANETERTETKSSKDNQTDTNNQMPQFQTSVQQAANAGLIPTIGTGESISQTASGFVPTTPGLTSLGAQASSAAAGAQKFLTAFATQSIAYSDNPGQIAAGESSFINQPLSQSRPDFFEVTSGGILLSKQLGLQNLFASASFSDTNYFHDKNFDSTRYSFSVGDNYVAGDICTGVIVANQSESAVPLELSAVSLSAQSSTNSSIEVSSRCRVTGHFHTTSDFRLSSIGFTDSVSSANNSMQTFGSGGLEYSVPGFITMGLLGSIQDTQFTDRGSSTASLSNQAGLANRTSQISFNAFINKPISKKLNVSLSGGIVDLATGSPTLAGSIEPIYTATLSYNYSPKTSASVNYTRLVGSPQSVVSNFQQIESASIGVNYRFSPKISFNAAVSRSSTSAPGGMMVANLTASNTGIATSGNFQSISEQINARYLFASNVSAGLSYQHIERTQGSLGTAQANTVSFSVNYRR